jgi:hypothetical protein
MLWLQDLAFSTWLRESDWAIFAVLIAHTIGMAFAVGAGIAIGLRVFGMARALPVTQLTRLAPLIRYGLIAAIASGVLLVMAYPAKALTNPLFYIKLVSLTAAFLATRFSIRRASTDSQSKAIALASVVLWMAGLVGGKFLAYTHTMLLVY